MYRRFFIFFFFFFSFCFLRPNLVPFSPEGIGTLPEPPQERQSCIVAKQICRNANCQSPSYHSQVVGSAIGLRPCLLAKLRRASRSLVALMFSEVQSDNS